MTANKNIKETRKGKKLKKNTAGYIIEIFFLIAAAVFLSVISPISLINPLGLLCAAAASALFSCVIFLTGPKITIPAGIVSFAAAYITGGDILGAFSGLAYIAVGALIYFGAKTGKKRTQITVVIACFMAVFCAVVFVLSVFLSTGAFSVDAGVDVINSYLNESVSAVIDGSPGFLQYINSIDADLAAVYKEEIFINMKAILPACFILYSLFTAYLATAVFRAVYNIFIPLANPGRKRIKNKYWRISISFISAVILIVSIFLAAVFSDFENPFPAIVLTNLIYILVPGFCLMGIYFSYDKIFKSNSGVLPVFLILAAVVLSFIFSAFSFAMTAVAAVFMVIGLYAALIGDIKKFYEKTKKLLFGDDDDDDYID